MENSNLKILKKRLAHCEFRTVGNPVKEPLRIQEKIRQGLRKTLNSLAQLVFDDDSQPDKMHINAFFKDFMNDVHVDMVRLRASREKSTGFIKTKGEHLVIPDQTFYRNANHYDTEAMKTNNKRVVANGLNVYNVDQWRVLYDQYYRNNPPPMPNHVMIAVGVTNYLLDETANSVHNGHMICAFKHMNILYCFNPWGEAYKLRYLSLPDEAIWERLRILYKCEKSIVYTGYNFQQQDPKGACVGFGYNFGTHMYSYILSWRFTKLFKPNNMLRLKYQSIPDIQKVNLVNNFKSQEFPNMYHSVRFNHFVVDLFKAYTGTFGGGEFDFSKPYNSAMLIYKNLTQRANVSKMNNNNLNRGRKGTEPNVQNIVYSAIMRSIDPSNISEQSSKFVKNMRKAKWMISNNSRNIKNESQEKARLDVLEYLQANNNRLRKVNHNSIAKIIRRYSSSGDIVI